MSGATTLPGLKRQMVRWSRKVWELGYVANHDGNMSCRLPGKRFLATPTSFSKDEIREDDLLVLDRHGKKLQGRWRPFSELNMHLAAYGARPDVNAVLHAHPPQTTGFSCAGVTVETAIIAEAVVSLGPRIPTIAFAMPGSEPQLEQIGEALLYYDALVIEGHGVLTVGKDLEQAFLRLELVEHLAKIKAAALPFGEPRRLTDHEIERLVRKRTKGGLGPAARGITNNPPL